MDHREVSHLFFVIYKNVSFAAYEILHVQDVSSLSISAYSAAVGRNDSVKFVDGSNSDTDAVCFFSKSFLLTTNINIKCDSVCIFMAF